MNEIWKDIPGFEGRYQVSDQGRVKALSRMQRYVHWRTGLEGFRRTKERIVAQNKINSGYLLVHLNKDRVRKALLVHRLVAAAFIPGDTAREVNHVNGDKEDNRAINLEWVSSTDNKLHAVSAGLNVQAIPVIDPATGKRYDSITQAVKGARVHRRRVEQTFIRDTQ